MSSQTPCPPGAPVRLALYRPEIAPNTAAILRTAVCLEADVHVIGPASFDLSDRAMRRAGLDYAERAVVRRHVDFAAFAGECGRLVLFTTRSAVRLPDFSFNVGDTLLFGNESSGVPDVVHAAAHARVRIPMASPARSLNLAAAVAIGLSQALSAVSGWDGLN